MIVGFDPGRDKCGLALADEAGELRAHQSVGSQAVLAAVERWCRHYPIERIVMGNGTTAGEWQARLREGLSHPVPITLVDERHSSLEARDRYWKLHPPRGLLRLVPRGLRTPPGPIDGIVAWLLIERYWQQADA